MQIDPWILAFSAVTVIATIWMGFRSARTSKTASDFFVAGRSVSVGWNASAISGEYLSAASFMGVAGMVMSSGYDALWYPVCYACGYLFLLLFIAGPLRRFGAYTIPDFAEGRFDSPVFRKIAVVFVLFIGFFYTMPQMKGAGTTLAYIFPGLPYWVGVVLVGAVITLNVALGGMKGITLVQAFQYWAKMFAISVPIFVLMAVYGHYGKQVEVNGSQPVLGLKPGIEYRAAYTPQSNQAPVASWKQRVLAVLPDSYAKRMSQTEANRWGLGQTTGTMLSSPTIQLHGLLDLYGSATSKKILIAGVSQKEAVERRLAYTTNHVFGSTMLGIVREVLRTNGVVLVSEDAREIRFAATNVLMIAEATDAQTRQPLPAKAPADVTWLNPFGPLTTKAARNAAAAIGKRATNEAGRAVLSAPEQGVNPNATVANAARRGEDTAPYLASAIPLRSDITPDQHLTVALDSPTVAQALAVYAEFTGRKLVPNTNTVAERVDDLLNGKLSQLKFITRGATPDSGVRFHNDGMFTAGEVKEAIEAQLRTNGLALMAVGDKAFRVERAASVPLASGIRQQDAGGALEKAWLAKHEKPLALLYTYSLIIALVCGTAGLPHILVRFYTNPDGVAAKRTTMWVMILIGVFYVFPPVFGVMGRNLLPELYSGAGAKGTDKVVLELPRILNEKRGGGEKGQRGKGAEGAGGGIPPAPFPLVSSADPSARQPSVGIPWGSILSGITCAGAFAAFMSTFSGLLVSMTGAMAHDVYGRMLNPNATPEQRLRAFKIGAVIIGGVAVLLGMQVEPLQINFMVGQAFAIAAASYFPLLFVSVWWRKLTMKGAATGMLTGGTLALAGISLTSFTDLKWLPLDAFWGAHPLLRILCEQPAIWAIPLSISLMVIVSRLTSKDIPADIRMKMLVLHAPEKLGLKQEYIQEQQAPPEEAGR